MKELLAIVAARRAAADQPFALATVVGVEGSSYRRPGARMLIGQTGRVAGSVSGGCLEEDVILRGQQAMKTGERQVVRYDTSRDEDIVFGAGLGCRGRIEILVERLQPESSWALGDVVERVRDTRQPETFTTEAEGGTLFTERIAPLPALLVFGGGPDVSPLVRLAREMGFYISVIDRRRRSSSAFPEADAFFCGRPLPIGDRIIAESDGAAVIMNHHYETDRDALEFMLSRQPAYVGMLGPRSRTDRILDELAKRGKSFSAEEIAPLHAPAGLDLGGEGPEQIALSIMAEMQACLTGRNAGKLRSRSAPINAR